MMGKRGPKPSGGQVLSVRLKPEVRAELDRISDDTGRPLSEIINHRLQRSLRSDIEVETLYGSKESQRMTHIMAIAIDRTKARFGERDWLRDAEAFEFAMETIIASLSAMHPGGSYNGPGNRGLKFHLDAKEEARSIWKNIIEYDREDPFDRHRNLVEDFGDLIRRPNIYRQEYKRRVVERTGTLMNEAGIPLDWNEAPKSDRNRWLHRRDPLLKQAQTEILDEMIAEGKDPRLDEEENI